ncbi:hypothetical protein J3R75_002401 [Oligosphaera ethanolica]|uniref:Uncharacterized protein n=1 Tax=Oligosphaera ethanolica TaxID=760260 RepID=A0AAE3VGU9_9BACT|nr:hypothetical protein [Oligosphaera ethanolica]
MISCVGRGNFSEISLYPRRKLLLMADALNPASLSSCRH